MTEKRKSTKKRNSKKSLFVKIIFFAIILCGIFWYFCGKPELVITENKIFLIKTEEPLLNLNFKNEFLNDENSIQSKSENSGEDLNKNPVKNSTENSIENSEKNDFYDYENSFTQKENSPLYFGNPSNATPLISDENNFLMEKSGFTISYNNSKLSPNWSAWHLSKENFGDADRADNFRADNELPENWYRVKKSDYQYNTFGFDRGHLCPSADRTSTQDENSETFLMTNMIAQSPNNNRGVWKELESYERNLVLEGNELYIIAGQAGSGGESKKGIFDSIPVETESGIQKINVPEYTWKIILVLEEGENDSKRVTENTKVIAVKIPNTQSCSEDQSWQDYMTTTDEIEELTSYDFLSPLPDEIENILESKI